MRIRLIFPVWRRILLLLASLALALSATTAQAHGSLIVAMPGPGNLLYLPMELAKKIGADTAEDATLNIRFFGGGPQALDDLLEKNSDFALDGMAALAEQRVSGRPLVSIAAISRVPAYSLLVRTELKDKIKQIADLKGHVIGVKGHTKGGRSASQMMVEYLLLRAGIPVDSVNFLSAGQNYDDQYAALASGTVDALMGDEPFASRLVKAGTGVYLADFHDPDTVTKLLGGLFLNAQVATREDIISTHPHAAEQMARIIRHTLIWIQQHSAQEIVAAMKLSNPVEREALLASLTKYKGIYSPDGAFSSAQVQTTERFFHEISQSSPAARALSFDSFIVDQWAGRTR